MPPDAIAIDHASKSYGPRAALREVSFQIPSGDAVGYLGPNGAGKTTTLRLLAGLDRPSGGSVRLFGLDPVADHDRALRRVGVLVETPGVVPYVTARDLLGHVARVKHIPAAEEHRQIASLAGELGFADHLDRPIGGLSTGLTRRLLLGVALVGDPEVLLLDEPTLGLDPAARADLRRILRELRGAGRTLLLSTHLLDDVEEVCTRVIFLRDGQVVGDEPVALTPVDAGGTPVRTIALGVERDEKEEELLTALAGAGSVEPIGPREHRVRFSGGEERQAEVIGSVVRGGLPLAAVTDGSPTLGQRYLERVGREDPA
ncbi:MAG: ABC transporter ATP-binding protein [Thermoplasmata archaeon]|nr:ABC transporter ATP-binding protein [Thermoplasmata archaeon]